MNKRHQAQREQMGRIEIERAMSPDECLIELSLMAVRGRNLHHQPRRPLMAHEGLLLELEAFVKLAEHFHQRAVLHQSFRVSRVERQRASQASLGGSQSQSRRNSTVPSATCASTHALSIASARRASVFA